MMRMQMMGGCLAVAAVGILLSGCGGSGGSNLDTVGVSGTVTLDGGPVDGATVTFVPQAGGTAATGQTDASGRYTLTSLGTDGAVPGEYLVQIVKYNYAAGAGSSGGGGEEMPADYQNPAAAEDDSGKNQLPEKYENAAQSGLKATVTDDASKNVFDFKLES